ncbi:MAG: DOMON-like domain-containing protein [Brevundimonas sp.]
MRRISDNSDNSDTVFSGAESETVIALIPHPSTLSAGLQIHVQARRRDGVVSLEYRVTGQVAALRLPDPTARVRTDGLWRTTCFEAFAGRGAGYAEYNLSPSGAWAAYGFDGYRAGMAPLEQPAPLIVTRQTAETVVLTADVVLPPDADGRIGLAAVLETLDGAISYWALAHPAEKPDFHHPDSFVLTLPETSA